MVNKKLSINRPDDLIHHEELKAVEMNPRDTIDNKYGDNTNEDGSHVYLISDLCLSDMSVPTVIEGENTGGDQAEQV